MAHNYDYSIYEDQCIPNLSQISSSVPLFTDPAVYHLTSYGVSPNFTNNGKSYRVVSINSIKKITAKKMCLIVEICVCVSKRMAMCKIDSMESRHKVFTYSIQ
jgi:hypothetical protein